MDKDIPKNILDDIQGYVFQQEPWMCQVACIKNLFITMKKHNPQCPSPTVNKINKVIGSKGGFITNYTTITYLLNSKTLDKTPFSINEKSNSNKKEFKTLLDNENTSPIMFSVNSEKYFENLSRKYKEKEIGYEIAGEHRYDHVLIAFDISEDVIFYDPYTPFLHLPGNNIPAKAMFKLPYTIVEGLWTEALMSSRWIMWLQKKNSPQKRLDNFTPLEGKNG